MKFQLSVFCIFDYQQTNKAMLTTVRGIFENGKVTLMEIPPVNKKTEVVVTFLEDIKLEQPLTKRVAGILSGKIIMSDDFDEPLDEFKEYM
ncbi:DUF2281 domain-containing protein [Dyadobacter linearis]|nr:DUF2281 domain-containing protein [Dyadobacter sp. CECT 9623]